VRENRYHDASRRPNNLDTIISESRYSRGTSHDTHKLTELANIAIWREEEATEIPGLFAKYPIVSSINVLVTAPKIRSRPPVDTIWPSALIAGPPDNKVNTTLDGIADSTKQVFKQWQELMLQETMSIYRQKELIHLQEQLVARKLQALDNRLDVLNQSKKAWMKALVCKEQECKNWERIINK
jgi:hypothetical protein